MNGKRQAKFARRDEVDDSDMVQMIVEGLDDMVPYHHILSRGFIHDGWTQIFE